MSQRLKIDLYIVDRVLSASSFSRPLLAKTIAPCSAVSLRKLSYSSTFSQIPPPADPPHPANTIDPKDSRPYITEVGLAFAGDDNTFSNPAALYVMLLWYRCAMVQVQVYNYESIARTRDVNVKPTSRASVHCYLYRHCSDGKLTIQFCA